MPNIAKMIRDLDGVDHDEFKDKEREFVEDMAPLLEERNGHTNMLSGDQCDWIVALWEKYVNI